EMVPQPIPKLVAEARSGERRSRRELVVRPQHRGSRESGSDPGPHRKENAAMNTYPAAPGSLTRTHPPEPNVVFFALPFGTKPLNGHDGETCDFDKVYPILEKTLQDHGYKPERPDGIYGPTAMIELIWRNIQRAEYVVVDFTTRNHNVTFEFGLALVLGKKI